MTSPIALDWVERDPPLPPAAALATGPAVAGLAAATARAVAAGRDLRVLRDEQTLLVLCGGPLDELPWADGVVYLGALDGVLVPTRHHPSLPIDIIRKAIRAESGEAAVLALTQDCLITGPRPHRAPDPADLSPT